MSSSPTLEALKEALQIKEQIASLEARLSQILGGKSKTINVTATTAAASKRGPRKMSAAARAKIAAAQRARWAKAKSKAPVKAAAKPAGKKKGGLTPEGRAKIVAALKARWAAKKAAKKQS